MALIAATLGPGARYLALIASVAWVVFAGVLFKRRRVRGLRDVGDEEFRVRYQRTYSSDATMAVSERQRIARTLGIQQAKLDVDQEWSDVRTIVGYNS